MKVRSQILSPSVARGIAIMCAAVFVASAHTAQAGINVWTSHGPPGGDVRVLAIDPNMRRTLYAGSEAGVFKSTDGGSTWNALNAGVTTTGVQALAIDPLEPRRVYAGTSGGGVFTIEQISACVGDCSGTDTVAVNDLITLVNIALGTALPSACPNGGLPLGGEVDVAVILQAVNNLLNGCGGGT
jgi:hypothetical protein